MSKTKIFTAFLLGTTTWLTVGIVTSIIEAFYIEQFRQIHFLIPTIAGTIVGIKLQQKGIKYGFLFGLFLLGFTFIVSLLALISITTLPQDFSEIDTKFSNIYFKTIIPSFYKPLDITLLLLQTTFGGFLGEKLSKLKIKN